MPVTDTRLRPLASIVLYAKGQGDPVVDDHGYGKYDVLAYSHGYGSSSRDGQRVETLEWLEADGVPIGVVCKPRLRLKDTRYSHFQYIEGKGTWEERIPGTGASPKYRLLQVDTSPELQWEATTAYHIPENPSVAFTLGLIDTPPYWNEDLPPYVRIEIGEEWGLEFSKTEGSRLVRLIQGNWDEVMPLDEPSSFGTADGEEAVVWLRCHRGRILVSMDRGRSYRSYGEPSGSPVTIAGKKLTLRGQGGMCVFGIHQLLYVTGVYTSQRFATGTSRLVGATPTIAGRYSTPGGTSIAFADDSTPASGIAGYRATLTPEGISNVPFTFYRSPELYAVDFSYPTTTFFSTGLGLYSRPFDGRILEIDIQKPAELDQATASVRVRKEHTEQLVWASGRYPKVAIRLGHALQSGAEQWATALVGYIETIRSRTTGWNDSEVRFEVRNVSWRFKRTSWTKLDTRPFAGLTVNAALDRILASEGLNARYRVWHEWGNRVTLPLGSPEDPPFWYPPGTSKWESMVEIAGFAGLEVVPTDEGVLITQPYGYVSPTVNHVWRMSPASELRELIRGAELGMDSARGATAVLVTGQDEWGGDLFAYAIDGAAERNPTSARFCPWREVVQEEVRGTVSPGLLLARAAAIAGEVFRLPFEAEVELVVDLGTFRRERARIEGSKIGIADWDEWAILTLQHHYEEDPSFGRLTTKAGLVRLS